jgi:gliding motility-associated-like protein
MIIMKNLSPYFLFLLLFFFKMNLVVYADHLIGGEMKYTYVKTLPNNQQIYTITTTIYRDVLGGGAGFDSPFYVTVFNLDGNTFKSVSLLLLGSRISPIALNNLGVCAKGVPTVQFEKIFYQFSDTVTVNQKGYLYVHQRCCRSSTITNLETPNQQGSSYTSFLSRKAMLLNNSNAIFPFAPPVLMCVKSNFRYQFAATDINGNRLKYYLCDPYYGADILNDKPKIASTPPYSSVQYASNYSYNHPFGDNVYVELDSNSGLLKVESDRIGYFTLGVCIDELDDQQKVISSSKRDFLFNVADCVVATARAKVEDALETSREVYVTCKSKKIQFSNQSIDAQSYFWDFGVKNSNKDTSTLEEPIFTYQDSGTYNVTLIINKGQTCADTNIITLKIYPLLKADFNYVLDCNAKQIKLNNSSTSTYIPITQYTWYNDQTVISNKDSFLYKLIDIGNYQFSLKTENQLGCIDSVSQSFDLIPFSKAVFKNSGIKQSLSEHYAICDTDKTVSFTNQSNINTPFIWKINNETKIDNSFAYVFPDTGTYKVLLITNPYTFCSDTSTHSIRILPPLKADFSFVNTCQTNPTAFKIEVKRPYDTIVSAVWNFGDGTTSTQLNPKKKFLKAQDYSILLSLQSEGGCKDDISKTITILTSPKADFEILDIRSDSNFIVCKSPTTVQFKNLSKNSVTSTWTIGEKLFQSNQVDIAYSFLDTGQYSIQLISNGISCSDTSTKKIQIIKDIQNVDFSYSNNCALIEMKLKNETKSYLNDIKSYDWDFGDGTTSIIKTPSVKYLSSGSFKISLKIETQLGCKDSIQKVVNVGGDITPIINQSQEEFCKNKPINFDASLSKGIFQTYDWDFGDGQISSLEKNSISFPQEGKYRITLTLEDSLCGKFETTSLISIISIPEINLEDSINICSYQEGILKLNYTSPFDSIRWSTGEKDTLQINIKNDIGQVKATLFYKGCEVKDSILVSKNCNVLIPKVFSPNGDGINDYFNILPYNIESFELSIYNKWGKLVFYTNELSKSWDGSFNGELLPSDNYIIYTKGIQLNGFPFEIKSSILLLR